MSESKLRLIKGSTIAHKGFVYRIANPVQVKVYSGKVAVKRAPVEADHQSDAAKPIDKELVCRLIQQEIDILEQTENEILFSLDEEELNGKSFTDHVGTTNQIMSFKHLLKKVNKL